MADKNLQFLDIPRADPAKFPVETRVAQLRGDLRALRRRRRPASRPGRCLACGNPFCEWKCPVHNYIPELAEAHPGRQPVRGGGAVSQDQLAAGGVRAHLSAGPAVRGRLHAQRRAGRGDHRLDREIHHRRGFQTRLEAGHVQCPGDRQAGGHRRRGTCGPRLRRHTRAQRCHARSCSIATRESAAC